jgi:hypothetical protein
MKYTLNTEYDRTRLLMKINTLKAGADWIVEVKKQKKPRSLDQNSLLWLWLTCLERDSETGYTKEEFYTFFLSEFPTYRVILERQVQVSSSNFDSVEMTRFLDNIQKFAAAELGIELPDPSDLRFQEFINSYQ